MLRAAIRAASAALLAMLVATACGGDKSTSPTQSILINVTTTELTVLCGGSGTTSATLTRGGGFAGDVSISISGLPDDVSATWSPSVFTGSTTSATLTIEASASALPGSYLITVTASSSIGQVTDTYRLLLVEPPDFSLNATPATLSITRGHDGSTSIGITRVGGFAGAVTLSLQDPPAGISATFSPVAVTGTVSSATISVAADVAAGQYQLTFAGTATGFSARTVQVDLTVLIPQDWSLSANPAALTIVRGALGTTTIDITRIGGYAASVPLSLENPPAGITGTFNPANAPGNSSTLTVSVATSVTAGSYSLTVLGIGDVWTDERRTQVQLTVVDPPDFSVTLNPAALSIERGTTGNTSVGIARLNGFAGAVTLLLVGAPTGITATFAPPSPTGATSAMSMTVQLAVAAGDYTMTVQGTGQGVGNRTATLILHVLEPQPRMSLQVAPTATSIHQWQNEDAELTLSRENFTGDVTFSASGMPNNMDVSFSPVVTNGNHSTITVDVGLDVPIGTYQLTILANGGVIGATAILSVQVEAAEGQSVEYQFCNPVGYPIFFAIQDGLGPWREVQPTVNGNIVKFKFPFVHAYGGYAFITQGASANALGSPARQAQQVLRAAFRTERAELLPSTRTSPVAAAVTTYQSYYGLLTLAELLRDGVEWCWMGGPTATLGGTMTGLVAGDNARVAIGGDWGQSSGAVGIRPFTIDEALLGTRDLFASRRPGGGLVDRYVVIRDLALSAGTVLPLVDFNGANSDAGVPATVNLTNTGGDFTADHLVFETSNGNTGIFTAPSAWTKTYTRPFRLVPPSLQRAGDVMGLEVRTSIGLPDREDDIRRVTVGLSPNQNMVDVAFGPAATPPTITAVATSPYLRFRFQGPVPATYAEFLTVQMEPWNGGAQGGNLLAAAITRGYMQAIGNTATYDVQIPDLSGIPNFPLASALPRGEIYIDATAAAVTGGVNQNPYQALRVGMRVDRARWLRFITF